MSTIHELYQNSSAMIDAMVYAGSTTRVCWSHIFYEQDASICCVYMLCLYVVSICCVYGMCGIHGAAVVRGNSVYCVL